LTRGNNPVAASLALISWKREALSELESLRIWIMPKNPVKYGMTL
jgi:hypothetical protein